MDERVDSFARFILWKIGDILASVLLILIRERFVGNRECEGTKPRKK